MEWVGGPRGSNGLMGRGRTGRQVEIMGGAGREVVRGWGGAGWNRSWCVLRI